MKVSDFIADFLEARGVPCVFELIGGMITHMVDSLHRRGRVPCVSVHHEQAAAFAADAVGRITGVPGVAMATSGPGATNLLTGIGSCYFDSSPAVFLTGQVNRHEMKRERGVRQLGFQETDIASVARPITKAAWVAESAADVPELLRRAFELAVSGRPGPVLLDMPMDVQREQIDPSRALRAGKADPSLALQAGNESLASASGSENPSLALRAGQGGDASFGARSASEGSDADAGAVKELLAALAAARRPMILVGGGLRATRAGELFRQFVRCIRVPVVNSLMAVDALPYDDPLRVGLIGTYGNRWANLAMAQSDLLLVLGSRLDIRQTGSDTKSFKAGRVIYHVDVDAAEINNRVSGCRAIVCDLHSLLWRALELVAEMAWPQRGEWLQEIAALRERWPDVAELKHVPGINPNRLMHQLSALTGRAAAFVADVGQHQMWAGQSLELAAGQIFMTSGGMGSMGFALPAAIGVAFAISGRPIVAIAGDGGFQCNIQELQTVVRNNLPIKMIVINNGCLGMVRQFQESYFDKRYASTLWGYSCPDFARVAAAYGLPAESIEHPEQVAAALARLMADPAAPALLQVMVHTSANAYPKIAFGRPFTDMEPLVPPTPMEQ